MAKSKKSSAARAAAVRDARATAAMAVPHCRVESSDYAVYTITSDAMRQSKILAGVLNHKDTISSLVPIKIPNVGAETLRKIIQWCEKHKDDTSYVLYNGRSNRGSKGLIIPEWDSNFLNRLNNQELFDIICAANYLDIPKLMDYSCKTVANMAKGKSAEQMRVLFGIPTDEEDAEALLNQPGPSNASIVI